MTVLMVIKLLAKEVILFPRTGSCGHSVQRLEREEVCILAGEKKRQDTRSLSYLTVGSSKKQRFAL